MNYRFSFRKLLDQLLIAVAAVAMAIALRIGLSRGLDSSLPFATFFPAILLATLYRGTLSGIVALVLSVAATWNREIGSYLGYSHPVPIGNKIAFVFASAALIWLAAAYRQTLRKLKRADSERQLLLNELEHRSKNKLAVMQSIIMLSLPNPSQAKEIVDRIRIAIDTDRLLKQHTDASLRELLRVAFSPYGSERAILKGEDVAVSPTASRSLSMIFHELVTNAVKYGALKVPEGRVTIEWLKVGSEVTLTWTERNGPPTFESATKGFGSKLITRTLSLMSGKVETKFEAEGFRCKLSFSLQ